MAIARSAGRAAKSGVAAGPSPPWCTFGATVRDFDAWEELGNEGWGFDDVLPYFKKAENQERGPSKFHGVGGPQNVADPRWVPPISLAFRRSRGRSRTAAKRGFQRRKAGRCRLLPAQPEKWRTAQRGGSLSRPALRRANLTSGVTPSSTRNRFRPSRAVGVSTERSRRASTKCERHARSFFVPGALAHLRLLMLSGVGPAEHLTTFDIAVVRRSSGCRQ